MFHALPRRRHDSTRCPPRPNPFFVLSGTDAGEGEITMPRYYRALLTTFLVGALASPAFAQTPAPMAPPAATTAPTTAATAAPGAPAADDKAPTPDTKTQKPVKATTHKHHRTAHV